MSHRKVFLKKKRENIRSLRNICKDGQIKASHTSSDSPGCPNLCNSSSPALLKVFNS